MANEKRINIGNLVTPNGASMIFGAKTAEDGLSLDTENSHTWGAYNIVIEEEDIDENIPATQITYSPVSGEGLESTTVQDAITELNDEKTTVVVKAWNNATTPTQTAHQTLVINNVKNETIYNTMKDNELINSDELYLIQGVAIKPSIEVLTFTLANEQISITDTSGLLSKNPLVFYNGLLMVINLNYTINGNTLTLSDFSAEESDVITLVGIKMG